MASRESRWSWSASRSVDDDQYPVLITPDGRKLTFSRLLYWPPIDQAVYMFVRTMNGEVTEPVPHEMSAWRTASQAQAQQRPDAEDVWVWAQGDIELHPDNLFASNNKEMKT